MYVYIYIFISPVMEKKYIQSPVICVLTTLLQNKSMGTGSEINTTI